MGGVIMPKAAIAPSAAGRERVAETGFVPECPLDHTPNAETIAAIQEGRDMLSGETPCKWMNLDELMQDLYS
jgi:hypothetical protein